MSESSHDLLRGTLDLLILRVLELEPMHGWGIAQRIQERSKDAFRVGQGSIYPALQRLEQEGWITSEWRASEQNRRAKYYELTSSGDHALAREQEHWKEYVRVMALVLGEA